MRNIIKCNDDNSFVSLLFVIKQNGILIIKIWKLYITFNIYNYKIII